MFKQQLQQQQKGEDDSKPHKDILTAISIFSSLQSAIWTQDRMISRSQLQSEELDKVQSLLLTVHTNPSLKRSFSKTFLKLQEFENAAFALSVEKNHFETGAFLNRWRHNNHVISLTEFSSSTNPKGPLIVTF